MALTIKEKKKRRQELRDQQDANVIAGLDRQFTKEDMKKLEEDLKIAE
jgi:hypothetical protein